MVFKTIGLIMIFLSCSIGGEVYAGIFKQREKELGILERKLRELESKIIYSMEPLPHALEQICKSDSQIIDDIFSECSNKLLNNEVDSVYDAFSDSIKKHRDKLALRDDDIDILLNISKSIGTMDEDGHKKMFESSFNTISRNLLEAHEDTIKNTKLYKCIGISLGLTIVIILI